MPERYKSPPNWTRDELILALDLYFDIDFVQANSHFNAKSERIKELSELLNSLPIHRRDDRGTNFRNPAGVYMKLSNFLPFDPRYPHIGLTRGGKLDRIVWSEFAGDPARVHQLAKAITAGAAYLTEHRAAEVGDEEFAEGQILTRLHKTIERNAKAIKSKKAAVLRDTGKLACEVCDFDFAATYGALGVGYAECHHKTPLASLSSATKTKHSDLAITCANCHRMIHRGPTWLSVDELRMRIASSASARDE